ncbi:hypothetical protein CFB47_14345 [Burkholderia sp. AU27893]|uniref:hypothetical protein n=1 Tax=Burkholderia sp. AU27893 TaxID=2015351 RepID=UPI000B79B725|nr:hypothetical protein CFB47_14345 [Burkholderia sp. AU27893]
MKEVILVTGASSCFGLLTAQALARAGHTVRVAAPAGKRPYRVFVDPSQDGAEEGFRVGDRIRREMFRNIGLADLLAARVGG